MHIKTSSFITLACVMMTLFATPASAHHAFASEFDINSPIELTGEVIKMEFSNPHCWIHLLVTTSSGEKQEWKVEGGSPNALMRRGWNRDSLAPGVIIHVEGFHARDRSFRASGGDVTFEDGSKLFVGSAGRGSASRGSPQ